MKLIEAMKRVKANKDKIADLNKKIQAVSANLSFETPLYGDRTGDQIKEWLQSCRDTSAENVRLLVAIQRTNLATIVPITLGGITVSKSVAEWIWRRREYATLDANTWRQLTDRGLKEGNLPTTTGVATEVKIVRHYDPVQRDKMLAMFTSEPHEIDAALEVINAITDLIES